MRTFCLSIVIGLVVALLPGCGAGRDGFEPPAKKSSPSAKDGEATSLPDRPAGRDKDKAGKDKDGAGSDRPPMPAAAAEAVTGADKPARSPGQGKGPQSGILTAGSFDDNLNPEFFRAFAGKLGQNSNLGDLPGRLRGQRLVVLVKGADGQPVGNARVQVAAAEGGSSVHLTTRTDGRVVILSSWDQVSADGNLVVTVTPPDGGPAAQQVVPRGSPRWEVTLPSVQASLPKSLDFALVLDTTGSMGDELEYLKSEVKSIAAAVKAKFPEVDQRYGLVLYRDEGDEYVTRPFNFTASIDEFRKNLGAQRAAGGGDEPEAMHRGLEEALQLRWREGNTARVLFLVTDAPPHAQHMGRTMTAANALRRQGVAIYPVACSGYNDEAELILRGCALLTGSQFLFLTDDSGVGSAHGEPHIPFYQVEKLDKLMIRMIASELSGKRLPPERADVLRTVGKPIN